MHYKIRFDREIVGIIDVLVILVVEADVGIAELYCLLDILAPIATIGKIPSGLQRRPSRQFPNRPDHPHKENIFESSL